MKRNLGIRGDENLGSEIIALLKSLGGADTCNWSGTDPTKLYFINRTTGLIDAISLIVFDDYDVKALLEYVKMTYNEFWQKYPFSIGDKVKHTDPNLGVGTIHKMKWDPVMEEVKYDVDFSWGVVTRPIEECEFDDLTPYDRWANAIYGSKTETEPTQEAFDFIESTTTTVNPEHNVVRIIIPESHEVLIRDGEVLFIKRGIIPTNDELKLK